MRKTHEREEVEENKQQSSLSADAQKKDSELITHTQLMCEIFTAF